MATRIKSSYDTQAEAFLNTADIGFSFRLIGSDCPMFCEDAAKKIDLDKVDQYPRRTHIHGKHYRCTFTRRSNQKTLVVDFWNSYADEEFNAVKQHKVFGGPLFYKYEKQIHQPLRTPTAYDVLACLEFYVPDSLEDFCSEFGYDTDSRKALHVYEAVQREAKDVRTFFTPEELEQLQEIR